MPEDIIYLEEEMYTDEDWDNLVLMGEIELRHLKSAGKEEPDGETAE